MLEPTLAPQEKQWRTWQYDMNLEMRLLHFGGEKELKNKTNYAKINACMEKN